MSADVRWWFGGPVSDIPRGQAAFAGRYDEWFAYPYAAEAECRACGGRIVVGADIQNGALEVMTSGRGPDCNHKRCGRPVPAVVFRYWPVLYSIAGAHSERDGFDNRHEDGDLPPAAA